MFYVGFQQKTQLWWGLACNLSMCAFEKLMSILFSCEKEKTNKTKNIPQLTDYSKTL